MNLAISTPSDDLREPPIPSYALAKVASTQLLKMLAKTESFPDSLGGQLRDFCYIDDITNGILLALRNNKINGEVINLGSGEAVSIRPMIETVQKQITKGKPEFGKISYRTSENMELYADISKAKKILNWNPLVSLDKGIINTVNYYSKGYS